MPIATLTRAATFSRGGFSAIHGVAQPVDEELARALDESGYFEIEADPLVGGDEPVPAPKTPQRGGVRIEKKTDAPVEDKPVAL